MNVHEPSAGQHERGARRILQVLPSMLLALLSGWALLEALPHWFQLRTSLAMLPLVSWMLLRVVASLVQAAGASAATAGRSRRVVLGVSSALFFTGLAPLLSGQPSLAPLWTPFAWCTVLALAVVVAPLARRAASRRGPSPPLAFLLAPFALYLLLLPWSTEQRPPNGDEPWYLLLAHSLAYDLDADLDNNYREQHSLAFLERAIGPQPGDPVGPEGQRYSRHSVTLGALLALPYRAGGAFAAQAIMALLSAAFAWLGLFVLLELADTTTSSVLLAWGLLAAFSPLLLFSHQIWVEVPAALVCWLGFLLVRRIGESSPGGRFGLLLAFVLVVIFLPLLKLRFGVLSVGLVLMVGVTLRHQFRRRLPLFAALALAGVASTVALLIYNQHTFGNPLRIHSWQEFLLFRTEPRLFVLRGSGILFDLAFGLFATAPLWLLIVPGVWRAVADRRIALLQGALVFGPYLLLVASRREWYGGWSPPFRYALVALPWFAWLVALALDDARSRPLRRVIAVGLLIASLGFGLLWVAQPGWTYNFADGRTLWLDAIEARLDLDLGRLLPSATRPRLASWLAPPLLVVTLLALWWLPRGSPPLRRRRASAALAGGGALLLALGGVVSLARVLPTWRVEPEAAFVERSGGNVEPEIWQFDRTQLPEAWVLPDAASLRFPVHRGGDHFRVEVLGRFIRNRDSDLQLHFQLADRSLGTITYSEPATWSSRSSPRWTWPEGVGDTAELLVSTSPPSGAGAPGVTNGLAIDRFELHWE